MVTIYFRHNLGLFETKMLKTAHNTTPHLFANLTFHYMYVLTLLLLKGH